jgi:hypothetical protein
VSNSVHWPSQLLRRIQWSGQLRQPRGSVLFRSSYDLWPSWLKVYGDFPQTGTLIPSFRLARPGRASVTLRHAHNCRKNLSITFERAHLVGLGAISRGGQPRVRRGTGLARGLSGFVLSQVSEARPGAPRFVAGRPEAWRGSWIPRSQKRDLGHPGLWLEDRRLVGVRAFPGLRSETWGTQVCGWKTGGTAEFVDSQVSEARPGAPPSRPGAPPSRLGRCPIQRHHSDCAVRRRSQRIMSIRR